MITYSVIFPLLSFSLEEKEEKRKVILFFLSSLDELFRHLICYCACASSFLVGPGLLIERVFVWRASVKYETDQSTLDLFSEQTMKG